MDRYPDEFELAEWEYEHRDAPPATESEAHLEWHRNSGVPVGEPCPWDACDPDPRDDDEVYVGLGDIDCAETYVPRDGLSDPDPDDLPF